MITTGLGEGWCKVVNVRGRGVTRIEQVQTVRQRGSKFWSFCNNVIIESCQTYKREHILQFKKQPQQYNGDIYVCFKKTIGLI